MADEGTPNTSAQAAPAVANAGAAPALDSGSPAGSTGGAAPVPPVSVEAAPQPAPAAPQPAPAAEAAPKVEAAPEAKPADAPKEPEQKTLLGAPPEKKTDAPKEGDTKPPLEGKEAEGEGKEPGGQSEEPAPPPSFEAFKLPENVKLDDARVGTFTSILGEFERTAKAPHAEVQNLGQKLVDFHLSEMQNVGDKLQQAFVDSWKKQTNDWLEQTKADPEVGGARHETALASAVEIINTYGGNEQQLGELREFFNKTGVGNHPALVRLLHNISKGPVHMEGSPKPAPKAVPEKRSNTQKLYGSNT